MTATILVVDDEPDLERLVLQNFRRQIRDGAVTFVFAHDGIEALQMIEQHPHVDMVVSDINMPRMDGLTLLQKLQEANAAYEDRFEDAKKYCGQHDRNL
jgi:adenylate cyclase